MNLRQQTKGGNKSAWRSVAYKESGVLQFKLYLSLCNKICVMGTSNVNV